MTQKKEEVQEEMPCDARWGEVDYLNDQTQFSTNYPITPITFDNIENPQHYNEHEVEAIDIIKLVSRDAPDGFAGSLIGNVQKYVWRCWYKKHTLDDLKKARWYLNRLIKYLETLNK